MNSSKQWFFIDNAAHFWTLWISRLNGALAPSPDWPGEGDGLFDHAHNVGAFLRNGANEVDTTF